MVKPFNSQAFISCLKKLDGDTKSKRVVLDLPKFFNLKKFSKGKFFPFSSKKNNGADSAFSILLVDDDKDTQYAMQYILEKEGYKVYVAKDGEEALKQAEMTQPNLILMDIMLPGMNGYEATRKLKSNESFNQIPIIAMTAKAMKGDREKVKLAGCDDYIAKPFMTKEILNLIEKWIHQCEFKS